MIRIKNNRVNEASLIAEPVHETKTKVTVRVVDCIFPVHSTCYGPYQIDEVHREGHREQMIGQKLTFWKTGRCANVEVDGHRVIVDWEYEA